MTIIVILVGALQAVMGVILALLVAWHRKSESRIDKVIDDFAAFRADAALRFANEQDIKRIEDAVAQVRLDLNTFTGELRTRLEGMSARLHELLGANANRG